MNRTPTSLRRSFHGALAAIALAAGAGAAQAQTYTPWAAVTLLEAGWGADSMAIYHAVPLINPNGCAVTNAGYATLDSDPGRDLYHTLLLSAFLNRKEVRLLVNGCAYNKPRVISVSIR